MTTKTAIDLQKFCASEDSNYQMKAPFTRGEFTYATNRHLIVRVSAVPGILPDEKAPNPQKLGWDAVVTDDQWLKITQDIKMVDCEDCQGGEKAPHNCPYCSCECKSCDNGKQFEESAIKIGSKTAQARYLFLIKQLPNYFIAPDATPKGEAIHFKFDGGYGLLMPMRD